MWALHIWFLFYTYSALTHIFLRLFYPYIFSAILPIYFFGYFTHIFFRLFYPYFLRLNHKFSWEYIILSSHIVVRIYCEHFGCLFLLVRLYTEIPWDYIETFWVPIFTGAAIHRWSFFFRFFPRLFSFFFLLFFDSNPRWLFSKFVYLSATRSEAVV